MAEEWELEDVVHESTFSESEEGENAHLAHKEGQKVRRLDVQHDSVLIKWTNGHANGSPIISYQVFAARIREFRYEDVQLQAAISRDSRETRESRDVSSTTVHNNTTTIMAGTTAGTNSGANAGAMVGVNSAFDRSSSSGAFPRVGSQSLLSAVIEEEKEQNFDQVSEQASLATGASVSVLLSANTAKKTIPSSSSSSSTTSPLFGNGINAGINGNTTTSLVAAGINESQLDWRDVTNMGEPMGPQAFRANGLSPGTSYVFCVRQRNEIGWSAFSRPRYVYHPIIPSTNIVPSNLVGYYNLTSSIPNNFFL